MAEKEEKKEEGGEKNEKKKNNMILFIVIGVLVLLLIIIGVVVAMMMGGDETPPAAEGTASAQGAAATPKDGERPKTKVKSNLMTIGPLYPMDQVIVNLLSQSGRRYLKTSISFEMSVAEMQPELDSKKPVIRDIVIGVLSSKTLEEISTSKGKEKLKEEIITKVNEIIVDGQIKNLFFTDFVIQ